MKAQRALPTILAVVVTIMTLALCRCMFLGVATKVQAQNPAQSATPQQMQEEEAYLYRMEAYVYGFPLVIIDVTKEVQTATPTSGEYTAPINQFARMHACVSPDFMNVVRISLSGLWSTAFVNLDKEPYIPRSAPA
jgi:hypothetical protein